MPVGGHPPHQIQALDRTQPGLPLKKGRAGTMTHDYKRHGTTTLFAALNILDGTVLGRRSRLAPSSPPPPSCPSRTRPTPTAPHSPLPSSHSPHSNLRLPSRPGAASTVGQPPPVRL